MKYICVIAKGAPQIQIQSKDQQDSYLGYSQINVKIPIVQINIVRKVNKHLFFYSVQ